MQIQKNQFLQYCVNSAATLGLPMTVLGKLEQALAVEGFETSKVIWFNGNTCTGCTVYWDQLFNGSEPASTSDYLFNTISLDFHSDLMTALSDFTTNKLVDATEGSYILVVDGDIPAPFDGPTGILSTDKGKEVNVLEALPIMAQNAAIVLAIGTSASFGETLSSNPNSNGIFSVGKLTSAPTVNIPGCPPHPDWIVWIIAHLLSGEAIQLDEYNRPVELYGSRVQKHCPHKEFGESQSVTAPDQSSDYLQFTKQIWDPQKCRLKVAGRGKANQIVSIYNAESGSLLGAVAVNELGKWKLRYNKPFPIPLKLLAKSGNGTVFGEMSILPNMSH